MSVYGTELAKLPCALTAAIIRKKQTLPILAAPTAWDARESVLATPTASRRFARRLFVCCTLNERAQRNRQASHAQSRLEHTSAFGFDLSAVADHSRRFSAAAACMNIPCHVA